MCLCYLGAGCKHCCQLNERTATCKTTKAVSEKIWGYWKPLCKINVGLGTCSVTLTKGVSNTHTRA